MAVEHTDAILCHPFQQHYKKEVLSRPYLLLLEDICVLPQAQLAEQLGQVRALQRWVQAAAVAASHRRNAVHVVAAAEVMLCSCSLADLTKKRKTHKMMTISNIIIFTHLSHHRGRSNKQKWHRLELVFKPVNGSRKTLRNVKMYTDKSSIASDLVAW